MPAQGRQWPGRPGVAAALLAAVLFGAGTPAAKWLLGSLSPWMLAGLLYLGAGIGLSLFRLIGRGPSLRLTPAELPWLAAAVLCGGVAGPVLLMLGLSRLGAAEASLLLNAESVLTAVLAWVVFRENVDRRVALGMLAIVAGAVVLGGASAVGSASPGPALAVLGACLCWALDNNLTRKLALADAAWLAAIKGFVAGSVNLALSLLLGDRWPALPIVGSAMAVGLLAYGLSLVLYIVGLRHLGTARTGAYFSVAPFFGAAVAVAVMHDAVTWQLMAAGALMALGVWLHLSERHAHEHEHAEEEHEHEHVHDGDVHHQHEHDEPVPPGTRHTHRHRQPAMRHSHPHTPDSHHRHEH